MVVHPVSSSKKLLKVVKTYVQSDGQTDGRPQRVTTSNPIPELKHVRRVNAEILHFGCVGGQRGEMLGDSRFIIGCLEEPVSGRLGVGDRLLSGERLGGDDEQRGLGVE